MTTFNNRIVVGTIVQAALSAFFCIPPDMCFASTDIVWRSVTPMPTSRAGLAAVAVSGSIYVVGGRGPGGVTGALEVYDPGTDSWTAKTSMPTPRAGLAVIAIGGTLYAIGGEDDTENPLDTVEAYYSNTDTWAPRSSLNQARTQLGVTQSGASIFVFGGYVPGSVALSKTEIFNVFTNSWIYSPQPDPVPGFEWKGGAFGTVNLWAYRLGGQKRDIACITPQCATTWEEETWVFQPQWQRWYRIPTFTLTRSGIATAELGGNIYAAGGHVSGSLFMDGRGYLSPTSYLDAVPRNEVRVFDRTNWIWLTAAPMPTPRTGLGGATVGNEMFFIGGMDASGYLSTVEAASATSVTPSGGSPASPAVPAVRNYDKPPAPFIRPLPVRGNTVNILVWAPEDAAEIHGYLYDMGMNEVQHIVWRNLTSGYQTFDDPVTGEEFLLKGGFSLDIDWNVKGKHPVPGLYFMRLKGRLVSGRVYEWPIAKFPVKK